MSQTLEKAQKVSVAEIVRHGEKLILPEGMTLEMGIDLLERRKEYENEKTNLNAKFDVLPFDGAHALMQVLSAKYGWAQAIATPGFFGSNPPQMISVEYAPGKFVEVPWGRFSLPNVKGYIETDVMMKNGRFSFSISATILRRDEAAVRSLFDAVREYLKTGSIYKGKAIKIRFRDDHGNMLRMPEPEFINTDKIDPKGLIYAKPVMDSVETNLFTPIRRVHDCLANDIAVKRGVLLGGTFGTGKTLAATVASRLAVDAGVTYVYIPRADELADAIEFGKQYQSPACVIFCEDVDRVTAGERSVEMDDILNILDGIDTKGANIITVLTTNDLNSINPAMLRPGRLDAVIDVTPPDAEAAEKLVRLYGGDLVKAETDLTKAGELLAGHIPATIAEVVKRAKLAQMRLQPAGTPVEHLSAEALIEASATMKAQTDLLYARANATAVKPTIDSVLADSVKATVEAVVADKLGEVINYCS